VKKHGMWNEAPQSEEGDQEDLEKEEVI